MKKEKLEKIIKHQKKIIEELEDTIIKFDVEVNKIHRENKELKLIIDKAIAIIQNDTTLNEERQRKRLIEMLEGSDK